MRLIPSSWAVRHLFVAFLSTGCRHTLVDITPLPAPLSETHCWAAVALSTLPADSVAVRFQRAFTVVGLTGAAWARSADTAWARAGPTRLQRGSVRATYASRVVAYWHGDSTHFRWYVATTWRPDESPTADTSMRVETEHSVR